jgi:hydroxyacylglutathione hydrolase
MHQLADDVWHVPLGPRDTVNAYILGDVLVDAGYGFQGGRALAAARERGVTEHALTHAHLDHGGGSPKVLAGLGIAGLAVGAGDAEDARRGGGTVPPGTPGALAGIGARYSRFKGSPVTRELAEGDVVGPGFVVLDVPGHSPGHVAYWREADGILIAGDVFFNMHLLTTAPGLRQPPGPFTYNPAQNRASMRKVAALEPRTVGFGHGPVVHDAAPKLAAAVARLPSE